MPVDHKNIGFVYSIFLVSLILVVVGSQAIVQYGLSQQNDDARHLKLAGRQLMLSERISKIALYIERDVRMDSAAQLGSRLDTLKRLAATWKTEYYNMLLGAQNHRNTPRIDSLLRENALRLDTIAVAVNNMVINPFPLTISKSVKTIAALELPFLQKMGTIVDLYQLEAEQKLSRIKLVEIILAIITLGILSFEVIYIFYPMIKRQQRDNEKLREATDKATQATQAKSEFLASMSHEIRTPLNGVIGFSELLMNTHLDANQRQYMETVNSSARGLLDIINDVLDISKIESGKFELAPERVNLKELVHQVTEVVRFQTNARNLELKLILDDHLPEMAELDPVRLRQVLINLMGNAVKFTRQGFIALRIELLQETDNRKRLRFSVTDTGIGIKPENQQKIFQAFSQEDHTIAKNFGGTGLGLSISNKLLGLMNSKLQLTSEVDKGSTFFFELNVVAVSIENKNSIKPVAATSELNPSGARIRILIAEDNAVNLSLIKIILNKKLPGAILVEARNGAEAVEKFEMDFFNLVLMDIQMPELDGLSATRKIRLNESKAYRTPILALTAGAVSGEREKCLEAGMDDFLTKPISGEALDKALARWLSQEPSLVNKNL